MTSLKNLKIKKFEYLLIQDANSLLGKYGEEIYKSTKNIKNIGLTKKIGISIYEFNTLGKILKKFRFDIIQAPLNIIDRRLLKTGWINKLKKKKIEIHVRSVFLQGLLLLKYNQLPKKLKKIKKNWIVWENWLKKNKLTPLEVCLSFVFNQKKLDGVVMGYDGENQLMQTIKQKKIKKKILIPNINIKNKNLIDPRQWSIL